MRAPASAPFIFDLVPIACKDRANLLLYLYKLLILLKIYSLQIVNKGVSLFLVHITYTTVCIKMHPHFNAYRWGALLI